MSVPDSTRKFHFLREIASGGFGRVYLAKVVHGDGFSRLAAVKVLHPKWTENEEVAQRMRDEARLLGMLRHRNIVDVLDLTRIDGRVTMVMEYLEAVDLKVIISDASRSGKRIPLKVILAVFSAVASALDAAYNRPPFAGEKALRVIHRDIKPSNIMIDANGLAKVLDFGVARAEFESREAKTAELSFGSVEYMSPERLFFEPESPASDVYSLGVTLFEAIALDKFGKAKLRAEAHEQYFAERFEDLLEQNPMPSEEVEDLLHDLLYDMTAFEEAGRPSAADCVTRMRSFARELPGEGLEEWAEREVPPLVQRYEQKPPKRQEGDSTSLVDRVLSEDSGGFGIPEVDDETDIPVDEAPPAHAAMSGARAPWDDMKKATLASLAGEGLGPSQSAWNPEAEPVLQKALGPPPPPEGVVSVSATGADERTAVPPKAPPPREPKTPAPVQRMEEPTPPVVSRPAPVSPVPEPPPPVSAAPPPLAPSFAPVADSAAPTVEMQWDPDFDSEPEAPKSGGVLLPVAAAMFVVLFLAGTVLAVGAIGVIVVMSQSRGPEPVAELPIEAPEPAPADLAPEPAPVPASEPAQPEPAPEPVGAAAGPRFVSGFPGTTKVLARCDNGTFEGTTEVLVEGEGIGKCTITALGPKRSRANAVVTDIEARSYACFEGNSDSCE